MRRKELLFIERGNDNTEDILLNVEIYPDHKRHIVFRMNWTADKWSTVIKKIMPK